VGALIFLTQVGLLINQFLVHMRTDVYFVIQDLARCKNLYGDAGAYLRFVARRLVGRRGSDPSLRLPQRERRVVRWYAALLLPGTVASIAFFLAVTLPILVALLGDAFTHVLRWRSPTEVVDGLVVAANIIGMKLVWAWAWWRRHGGRVRQRLAAIRWPARQLSRIGGT
jgi:putative peptide zinc metalloprotease protein